MTVGEKFGRNLFKARRRAALSQEALAIRAELHRSEIGLLVHGRRVPRIETLAKLAGAIEIQPPICCEGSRGCPETHPGARDVAATLWAMAKRSKKPADLNRLAAAIVGDATDETPSEPETPEARAGRIGGRKGGKARAKRMTAEQRSAAARRAAQARWRSGRA